MSLPEYSSIVAAEQNGLVGLAGVARLVNRARPTVHAWIRRRRTSGFPVHKAVYRQGTRIFDLFDRQEVLDWYETYIPARGGAPAGNKNWAGRRT